MSFENALHSFNKFYGHQNVDDRVKCGIGGFTAEVRVSEVMEYTSDVPDNYVEDGSVINDHIINAPITLNLEGEVADIYKEVLFPPPFLLKLYDKASKITSSLYPIKKTQQAMDKINKMAKPITDAIDKIDNLIEKGQELYDYLSQEKIKTRQNDFFEFLERIYYTKQLISVYMPFKTYKNMRIHL